MEEYINIEIRETNWGKEQIIINKKYKINFSFIIKKKINSKVYGYEHTEYKILN